MARHDIRVARKENIIDSALHVFAHKGYADTTMTDIAKKAGVSTPVLYWVHNKRASICLTIITIVLCQEFFRGEGFSC